MGGFSKGWKIEKIGSPQRAAARVGAQAGDQYCTMIPGNCDSHSLQFAIGRSVLLGADTIFSL